MREIRPYGSEGGATRKGRPYPSLPLSGEMIRAATACLGRIPATSSGMPAKSSSSKLITIIILIPVAIAAWFIAPFFLPVWRWTHVDWEVLAKEHGVSVEVMRKPFAMVVRHAPRGEGDPLPWQIVECKPKYNEVFPQEESEHEDNWTMLVRCNLINDQSGNPPSALLLGPIPNERYFSVQAYRIKPGTSLNPGKRPLVIYEGSSIDKIGFQRANGLDETIRQENAKWSNDDEMEGRDDGYRAPGKNAE